MTIQQLSQILIDGICETEIDKEIRKDILDGIENEEYYDIACDIFNKTSQAYFSLALKVYQTLHQNSENH